MKSRLLRGAMRLFGSLGIDGTRQLEATRYALRRFFDAYLKAGSPSRLDITSAEYPEIHVLE
jgi:hypothetical protein